MLRYRCAFMQWMLSSCTLLWESCLCRIMFIYLLLNLLIRSRERERERERGRHGREKEVSVTYAVEEHETNSDQIRVQRSRLKDWVWGLQSKCQTLASAPREDNTKKRTIRKRVNEGGSTRGNERGTLKMSLCQCVCVRLYDTTWQQIIHSNSFVEHNRLNTIGWW